MYKGNTFLAVIAARKGSKRLPDKNMMLCNGKPLLWYTIQAIFNSGIFDRVVISTDCDIMAKFADCHNIGLIGRPDELATDTADVRDVVVDVCNKIKTIRGETYDYIHLFSPTNPLRDFQDIESSTDICLGTKADGMVSVVHTTAIEHCGHLPNDFSLRGFCKPDHYLAYHLEPTYKLTGGIYLAKWDIWAQKKDIYDQNIYAYIMEHDVDIDTMDDFLAAEAILRSLRDGRKTINQKTEPVCPALQDMQRRDGRAEAGKAERFSGHS